MTAEVLMYFELPFQQNRQKHLSPKGVQFSQRLFTAHGEQTRSVNCIPVSKWKPSSSRNLDHILGQNISSFRTIEISVRESERTISSSLPGL